jgi:hypothetical protein
MARFTIVDSIRSGNTDELGRLVAQTLNERGACTVEVLLQGEQYELRVWDGFRDDGSNRRNASDDTEF